MASPRNVLAIVGSLAALAVALWANPEVMQLLMPSVAPPSADAAVEPPPRQDAAGEEAVAEADLPRDADTEVDDGARRTRPQDDPRELADTPAAARQEPQPLRERSLGPPAEGHAADRESGVQIVVMRLNEHARDSRVVCDSIVLEGTTRPGLETYQVEGRGDPTSVATFLARLENDGALARLTGMHLRAADADTLHFVLSLNVVSASREG